MFSMDNWLIVMLKMDENTLFSQCKQLGSAKYYCRLIPSRNNFFRVILFYLHSQALKVIQIYSTM